MQYTQFYYFHSPCPLQRYPSLRLLHNCTYTNSFIGRVSLDNRSSAERGFTRTHGTVCPLYCRSLAVRRYRCGSEPLSTRFARLIAASYTPHTMNHVQDLTTMILLIESGMYYRVCNMGISAIRAAFPHFGLPRH
jgi:hypothetical protein